MNNPELKRLEGRIALITGASRGIGAAVAKAYAAEGAHVILVARTTGGLEEVDDAIKENGGTATLLPLNLMEFDKVDQIGPTIAERFGRLDILVGNAAYLGALSPVAQSDPKLWESSFALNVLSNYRLIRSLDPLLRGSDAGRAIFVTSGAAHMDVPFWGAYASSKAALEVMVNTYAKEVSDTPLRVNIIDPGVIRTAMRAEAFPGEDPMTLPEPDSIVEDFIDLAVDNCTHHGELIKTMA